MSDIPDIPTFIRENLMSVVESAVSAGVDPQEFVRELRDQWMEVKRDSAGRDRMYFARILRPPMKGEIL